MYSFESEPSKEQSHLATHPTHDIPIDGGGDGGSEPIGGGGGAKSTEDGQVDPSEREISVEAVALDEKGDIIPLPQAYVASTIISLIDFTPILNRRLSVVLQTCFGNTDDTLKLFRLMEGMDGYTAVNNVNCIWQMVLNGNPRLLTDILVCIQHKDNTSVQPIEDFIKRTDSLKQYWERSLEEGKRGRIISSKKIALVMQPFRHLLETYCTIYFQEKKLYGGVFTLFYTTTAYPETYLIKAPISLVSLLSSPFYSPYFSPTVFNASGLVIFQREISLSRDIGFLPIRFARDLTFVAPEKLFSDEQRIVLKKRYDALLTLTSTLPKEKQDILFATIGAMITRSHTLLVLRLYQYTSLENPTYIDALSLVQDLNMFFDPTDDLQQFQLRFRREDGSPMFQTSVFTIVNKELYLLTERELNLETVDLKCLVLASLDERMFNSLAATTTGKKLRRTEFYYMITSMYEKEDLVTIRPEYYEASILIRRFIQDLANPYTSDDESAGGGGGSGVSQNKGGLKESYTDTGIFKNLTNQINSLINDPRTTRASLKSETQPRIVVWKCLTGLIYSDNNINKTRLFTGALLYSLCFSDKKSVSDLIFPPCVPVLCLPVAHNSNMKVILITSIIILLGVFYIFIIVT